VLRGLEFLGVQLDERRNDAAGPDAPASLGADGAPVLPVDEERQIARDAVALLRGENTGPGGQ
jgi:acetate kinase